MASESLFCADYPDVLVADAEALEIALRKVLDDDEACDAAMRVLEAGWRPPNQWRPAPKFGRDDAYYFGCRRSSGHHFVNAWGESPGYQEVIPRSADHTLVLGDDWMGLYIYGRLVAEGHSLSTSDVLSALGIMWRVLPADQTWLEGSGSLPERLDDVETGT